MTTSRPRTRKPAAHGARRETEKVREKINQTTKQPKPESGFRPEFD
jgi:hypothetical protein